MIQITGALTNIAVDISESPYRDGGPIVDIAGSSIEDHTIIYCLRRGWGNAVQVEAFSFGDSGLRLRINTSAAQLIYRVLHTVSANLIFNLPAVLPENEMAWIMFSVHDNGVNIEVTCNYRNASGTWAGTVGPLTATRTVLLQEPTGTVRVGQQTGINNATGLIGYCLVRSELLDADDLQAIVESGRYGEAYTRSAGNMTGINGVLWSINHGFRADFGDFTLGAGDNTGREIAANELLLFDRASSGGMFDEVTSTITKNGQIYMVDPYLAEPTVFNDFVDAPSVPVPPYTKSSSPLLKELADSTFKAARRMVVGSNSRGVRVTRDRAQTELGAGVVLGGSYAHGLVQAYGDQYIGEIMAAPTNTVSGGESYAPFWLGAVPPLATNTSVIDSANQTDLMKFSLFGRFSDRMGQALSLQAGGIFSQRAHFSGILWPFDGDSPTIFESILLSYPGSQPIRWRWETGSIFNNSAVETNGDWNAQDLDSSVGSRVLDGTELATSQAVILNKAATASLEVGHFLYCPSTGFGGEVTTIVEFDATRNAVGLHAASDYTPPSEGVEVYWGPASYVKISHAFPALSEKSKGLRIEVVDDSKPGDPVIVAHSSYMNKAGLAVGRFGWGGNGWTPQRNNMPPSAIQQWFEMANCDYIGFAPAQQNSNPADTMLFATPARSASPNALILFLGDMVHFASTYGNPQGFSTWNQWGLDNASLLEPAVGLYGLDGLSYSAAERLVRGEQYDSAHPGSLGMKRLAESWKAQFSQAFVPSGSGFRPRIPYFWQLDTDEEIDKEMMQG